MLALILMTASIESGTSISHYRIIAPLGAGGMGEVYKAQDTTLDRTVALKILPPDVVKNDERVRRFVQEAKSASSLNHPNIITIHEIGRSDEIHYIAMELVDGVTLKRKIHAADSDLRTLLSYLAQAADGLAKAHAAGIIHRDLKPENVMITRDGFAKVLDFGLAKLSAKKGAEGNSETTAVREQTREGAVLGTVAYMSPEQVQGKVVDHRTDVFSFGCMLYEAATHRRPFDADSDVDLMHKILHDKPVPVDEINPNVPAEVRRIIRRCLAKDPDRRYQSMKDLAIELHDVVDEFEELSASIASRSSGSLSQPLIPPRNRKLTWALVAAGAVLALAVVGFGVFQWRQARSSKALNVAYGSMKFTPATTNGKIAHAAVSPDGKYIAHVISETDAKHSLWVRQLATGSDVQVVPAMATGFTGVTFSPDGNYLLYTNRETPDGVYAWLFQVPALGGATRKLLFDVDTAPAFSPDGKRIAFGRGYPQDGQNAVVVANADGTGEKVVARLLRLGENPIVPTWSRDGTKVVTLALGIENGFHVSLTEIDVASGQKKAIGPRWSWISGLAFLPDASGIVIVGAPATTDQNQVWIQPYPAGVPVRVTNDTNRYAGLSLTADGRTITTIRVEPQFDLMIGDASDPTGGKPLVTTASGQTVFDASVAATGAIAYEYNHQGGVDIGILDSADAAPRALTTDGKSFHPSISGDGKTIVFGSERGGTAHVFAIDADGSNLRQLTNGAGEGDPEISRDGAQVIYRTGGSALRRISATGGQATTLAEKVNTIGGISPDSNRLLYTTFAPAGNRFAPFVRVVPLAGGPPLIDMPWNKTRTVRWGRDGTSVTFVRSADGAPNIWSYALDGGKETQLTRFTGGIIQNYAWTAEGKLVISRGNTKRDAVLISNFR